MRDFKAGTYISQGYYRSFQPNHINRDWALDVPEIISLISRADRELGRLDMFSEYIPNIDLFIRMHVVKEATNSSRIEGTHTNMQEALLQESRVPYEKRDDWKEVQNYVDALHKAHEKLAELPISSRLIKETHKILLQGVRGQGKQPGEFRSSQNWIGGATLDDAVFVPPVHHTVPDLMSDLEKFVHRTESYIPDLMKVAIMHYQFETIHPFLDGNGRIGRLLIPLYLIEKKIIRKPILYISEFFEQNRILYYDNLMRVRTHNDIVQWLKFFLVGLIETATKGVTTFNSILKLKEATEEKVMKKLGSRSHNGRKLLNHLYFNPITDAHSVAKVTELSMASAYSLITDFEKMGILREITGDKRNRLFQFEEYLKLYQ